MFVQLNVLCLGNWLHAPLRKKCGEVLVFYIFHTTRLFRPIQLLIWMNLPPYTIIPHCTAIRHFTVVTDDHMQLDKVIDNYFNFENSCDPNPLTSGNINSLYHDIDTVGLQHLKDYRQNSKFSCMHLNIRSLPDKLKKFLTNLDNEKIQFDAIILCETFLTDTNHDLFNIPGYTFISRHRKHYRQGGVWYLH